MKKLKHIAIAFSVMFALNGCTWMMWGMNDPFSETTRLPLVGKDNIHSFGIVKENTTQLAQNSLVMMGSKYWFVINPNDSVKLMDVLNAKLDKQFKIVERNPRYAHDALPVILKNGKSAEFSSDFCLRYDTDKTTEIAKLQDLSFKPTNFEGKTIYMRCVEAEGKYYNVPQQIKADYNFKQSVPVEIRYREITKHTDTIKLISNIAATPLTLMGDAALAVIALPIGVLDTLAGAVTD